MHTDSAAKLNFMLSADTYCVLNPQTDKVAEKLLFNVLCAARNAEYILPGHACMPSRCGGSDGGLENELQINKRYHT